MKNASTKYSSIDDLIQGIRANRLEASGLLFGLLYRGCFDIMLQYFSQRGLDEFKVQILFDEGVAVVERKIKEGKFPIAGASAKPLSEQMNAYLMQIVKYQGLKHHKTDIRHQPIPFAVAQPPSDNTPLNSAALDVVATIGTECKTMIIDKCIFHKSWKQIAEKLGQEPDAKKLQTSLNRCLVKYLSKLAATMEINENKQLLEEIAITAAKDLEEPCATIIKLFYENVSLADIAQKAGYNDPNTVKNKKYECMRYLNIQIAGKLLNRESATL